MNVKLGNSKSSFCHLSSVICPLSSVLYRCRARTTNSPFFNKQSQFPKKSSERNRFNNNELWQNGHLVRREKQSQFKPNTNPIQSQYEPKTNPIYLGVAFGEAGSNPILGSKNAVLQLFTVGFVKIIMMLRMYMENAV